MSRTYAGFLFKCKECGEMHLLDMGEPHKGIRLPCAKKDYAYNSYDEKDFNYWHGCYWDVYDILVQEIK